MECPRQALADSTLSAGARLVLVALWSRAGRERRFVWPSRDTLAADCGMAPRTLRKHLAALRAARWVVEYEGPETRGNPGWQLCDPPGTPQVIGIEAPVGTHDRAAQTCRASPGGRPKRADERHEHAGPNVPRGPNVPQERPRRAARISIGTNNEPSGGGYAGERESDERQGSTQAQPPPPVSSGIQAHTWRMDFVFAWRQRVAELGCSISDPTRGAHKVVELQRMLDDHGPDVVRDVLLHAAGEVARHHESKGSHGLHPGALGVVFRADKPQAFDARLDAWQRDEGRKRVSGRTPAAPSEIDGQPLTDGEARAWMLAMGQDPVEAVRQLRREAASGQDFVADLMSGLGLGGAA